MGDWVDKAEVRREHDGNPFPVGVPMESSKPPITHFAPPERAGAEELRRVSELCRRHSLSGALLAAVPTPLLLLNAQRQVVAANEGLMEALGLDGDRDLLGLRPGELLRCAHVSEGPGGCGTARACAQCGALLSILDSQAGEPGAPEACLLSLMGERGRRAGEFRVKATPLSLDGEPLTVLSLQDLSAQKRCEVLERLLFQDLEGLAASLDSQVQRLLSAPEQASGAEARIQELSTRLGQEILAQRILLGAERGSLRVEFQTVPVKPLLDEVRALVMQEPLADGRRIEVETEADASLESEPVLLRRALMNLLRNALEAVPRGATVWLRHRHMDSLHRFEVENPGAMPQQVALQVFQRSFSTKAAQGRGQGTYGARLLVEDYLGGSVAFTSEPAQGTLFWIEIPGRAPVPSETPAEDADAARPLRPEPEDGVATVLVVDDSKIIRNLLATILGKEHRVLLAEDGEAGLRMAQEHLPDLILLDVIMPGLDGYAVCARLKSDPRTEEIPVLFLSGLSSSEDEALALDAGAIDFITKPVRPVPVAARVRNQLELKRSRDRLRDLSLLDGLTGVANRRRFDRALESEWRRGRRSRAPLSVILGDVDWFKAYNDGYGHAQGDECLKLIARSFSESLLRPSDLAARYGGEEFVCILPETDAEGALEVAERIRAALKALQLPHEFSPASPFVSVSLGVATVHPDAEPGGSAALMRLADERLYQAKAAGRDRVVG